MSFPVVYVGKPGRVKFIGIAHYGAPLTPFRCAKTPKMIGTVSLRLPYSPFDFAPYGGALPHRKGAKLLFGLYGRPGAGASELVPPPDRHVQWYGAKTKGRASYNRLRLSFNVYIKSLHHRAKQSKVLRSNAFSKALAGYGAEPRETISRSRKRTYRMTASRMTRSYIERRRRISIARRANIDADRSGERSAWGNAP